MEYFFLELLQLDLDVLKESREETIDLYNYVMKQDDVESVTNMIKLRLDKGTFSFNATRRILMDLVRKHADNYEKTGTRFFDITRKTFDDSIVRATADKIMHNLAYKYYER